MQYGHINRLLCRGRACVPPKPREKILTVAEQLYIAHSDSDSGCDSGFGCYYYSALVFGFGSDDSLY